MKNHKLKIVSTLLLVLLSANISAQQPDFISVHQKSKFYVELKDQSLSWNEGFSETIAGDKIFYYSGNPKANQALITRASDGSMSIEWKTAPVQTASEDNNITFVWLAGINCNTNEQPFDLELNGQKILTFPTRFAEEWRQDGVENTILRFSALHQDANGDLFGYMFLTIPADKLEQGKHANLKITGQAKSTNNWMMVFRYPKAVNDFQKTAENGFWYKLSIKENKKEVKVHFPSSWVGDKIKLKSQSSLLVEDTLSSDNNCSLIITNNFGSIDYPIELFVEDVKIDEIPLLSGSDESYSARKDGSVIYRTWKNKATEKIIECSQNDFITIPEEHLSWPEYAQDFPSITIGKDNTIWMAVTERLAYDSYVSVFRISDGKQKKICMLQLENQTGIAAPAIVAHGNSCVVFFPVEKKNKWIIAYSFVDENNHDNQNVITIDCDGTSNISPSAAVSGNEVFVAWESNAGGARGIYSCAVTKKGCRKISRLSSSVYNSYNPAIISMENGTLFAAWDSYQNSTADIWGAKFKNRKWEKEFRITSDPRIERHPCLAVNGSDLWISWQAQSYGNTPSHHNLTKSIRLNHVDEQRIVVAQLVGNELKSPLNLFDKTDAEKTMLLRPKISFTSDGRLILTAREPINIHDGWFGVFWTYQKNKWSDKMVLHEHRGRWRPVNIVCSADSVFVAVQYDSRPKSGGKADSDKDWKSAVTIKSIGINSTTNRISLDTEVLQMPHTDFSLSEKSKLVAAVFPRKESLHQNKNLKLFFGDFHEHTDISSCARDANPPGHDLFANLRDIEKLDYCALTDHHNSIDRPIWSFNSEQTRNNHDAGRFVTFLAQEWSSSAGSNSFGYGHHNFIYLNPFLKSYITSKENYLKPTELWDRMKGTEFIAIPHQLADWSGLINSRGAWGNPPKDWNYYDEKLQPVAEIFQERGSYEYYGCPRQAEEGAPLSRFYLQDAWKRKIIIGVIASPDHGGGSGKMGVWAEELTRENIFNAIKARHTFGTTGAKMKLLFSSGSALMGDKVMNIPDTLRFKVEAEAMTEIKEVVIFRNNRIIYRGEPNQKTIDLEWIDENPLKTDFAWYYVRIHTVDDELGWSSPIWFIKE